VILNAASRSRIPADWRRPALAGFGIGRIDIRLDASLLDEFTSSLHRCAPVTAAIDWAAMPSLTRRTAASAVLLIPGWLAGQQRGATNAAPAAEPALLPAQPVTRFFTQDPYTEYSILEPGSEQFRIRYLPEQPRAGSTELVNATRGGSEGSDIQVFDPRTGKPLEFKYEQQGANPDNHAIRATLAAPVPEGGIGRVLIYKTYKDPLTYMMRGEEILWVRSLAGYRLGVILPKGYAFASCNVAAQLSTLADGRLKIAFANPSGQSNPVTLHAHKTSATFTPLPYEDMFFDDIKTLYTLGDPETHSIEVEQIYSDYHKGAQARLDTLQYLALQSLQVTDLDTAQVLDPTGQPSGITVPLAVPIADDKQSAHLKITGTLKDPGYRADKSDLYFDRTLHGLRNTVVLPAGWEVSAVSQSGTIGLNQGRAFVSLINLNGENQYRVAIHARKKA
jgi:hypothetical protein